MNDAQKHARQMTIEEEVVLNRLLTTWGAAGRQIELIERISLLRTGGLPWDSVLAEMREAGEYEPPCYYQ